VIDLQITHQCSQISFNEEALKALAQQSMRPQSIISFLIPAQLTGACLSQAL